MDINWTSPEVQAAIIQSVGGVLAAAIAAIAAAVIGRQFANRERLRQKLALAVQDIAFLLAVEAEHCNENVAAERDSNKIRIRSRVRNSGLQWSGRFTPGRRSSISAQRNL